MIYTEFSNHIKSLHEYSTTAHSLWMMTDLLDYMQTGCYDNEDVEIVRRYLYNFSVREGNDNICPVCNLWDTAKDAVNYPHIENIVNHFDKVYGASRNPKVDIYYTFHSIIENMDRIGLLHKERYLLTLSGANDHNSRLYANHFEYEKKFDCWYASRCTITKLGAVFLIIK